MPHSKIKSTPFQPAGSKIIFQPGESISLNSLHKGLYILSGQVKLYIRWIANRRLVQLGLEPIYQVDKNPLTWLDTMLNAVEHMNFFEGRSTEYSKASTKGTWAEAFS